jgi:chromosome segregation ATPase
LRCSSGGWRLFERERQLAYLPQRLDEFSRIFEALSNQADELRRKQVTLEPLQEQLGQVHDMSAQVRAQFQLVDTPERRVNALQGTASDMHEEFTALLAQHAELAKKSDEFEQKMKALADREAGVAAVKEEPDTVHQISASSKADLQCISDHHQDLALLRSRLEELLTLTAAAEQKIRRIL